MGILKSNKRQFTIHYLGPEKEVGQIEVWREILEILPDINLSIYS